MRPTRCIGGELAVSAGGSPPILSPERGLSASASVTAANADAAAKPQHKKEMHAPRLLAAEFRSLGHFVYKLVRLPLAAC
jgi:hypothetical protein